MKVEDWIKLYKALQDGGRIQDVIYDESRSLRDQNKVQLMLNRDTFITVQILKDEA